MPGYRAYLVDSEGHIKKTEIVEADDDGHALEKATQYVDGYDVEVWDRDRRIAIIKREK